MALSSLHRAESAPAPPQGASIRSAAQGRGVKRITTGDEQGAQLWHRRQAATAAAAAVVPST